MNNINIKWEFVSIRQLSKLAEEAIVDGDLREVII